MSVNMNDEAAQLAAFEQLAAAEAAKQPVAEAQQAAEILEP